MPFFKKCCHITSLSYTLGKRMFYRLLLLLPYSCWPGWMVSGCAIRVQHRAHVPSCKACGSRGRSSIFFFFSRGCKSLAKVNATPEKKEVIQVIVHAQVSSRICVVCAGFSPEQWSIAIKQKKILFILNSRVV